MIVPVNKFETWKVGWMIVKVDQITVEWFFLGFYSIEFIVKYMIPAKKEGEIEIDYIT